MLPPCRWTQVGGNVFDKMQSARRGAALASALGNTGLEKHLAKVRRLRAHGPLTARSQPGRAVCVLSFTSGGAISGKQMCGPTFLNHAHRRPLSLFCYLRCSHLAKVCPPHSLLPAAARATEGTRNLACLGAHSTMEHSD